MLGGALAIGDSGPSGVPVDRYVVWTQGFGSLRQVSSDRQRHGSSSRLGGGSVGLEWRRDNHDRIGLVAALAESSISVDGVDQKATQSTHAAGIYGSHAWQRYIADASLLFSYNTATSQRTIALLGRTATGSTDGYGAGLSAGLGYAIDLSEDTVLTPRVGASYTYTWQNGYNETGAPGANLAIRGLGQHQLQTSVAVTLASTLHLEHEFGQARSATAAKVASADVLGGLPI